MDLFLAGLDHTTAPVEIRERLAFNAVDLPAALLQLTARRHGLPPVLAEAVILSTCNRVEIYGVAADASTTRQLVRFLADFHHLTEEEFVHTLFFYTGEDVAHHLFATASGLHSLVLGEAQIQGQVRAAHEVAQQVGTVGPVLSQLFRRAIVAGKRVRHETPLGQGAASVSQAGVELARRRLGGLEGRSVLLVGSGEVSELAAQNLLANGARDLMVVNRTLSHAEALAERYGAKAFGFDAFQDVLVHADIVISSTAAPVTIIHRNHIEMALNAKRAHLTGRNGAFEAAPEMLLIDLAVPRDISCDVGDLPGVHLCTVDDLQHVVNQTLEQRRASIDLAQAIVDRERLMFHEWLQTQEAMPMLISLRQQAEALRCSELDRFFHYFPSMSPEQQHIVEAFSRSLVNKLLHVPTVRLKDAAAHGDGTRYAAMLRELFDLEQV